MSKITFTDVLALAKSGWTPAAVKELMDAEIKEQNDPAPVPEEAKQEASKEEVDYKAMYESTKKELDTLQQKNTQKEIQDPDELKIDEVIKNITSRL
ncbi:MAG: hypothetical protein J6Q39_06980 [Bacteroidales bacterium]|nr:hypothetical protein [Bacteroidales bacterium]